VCSGSNAGNVVHACCLEIEHPFDAHLSSY
jgi:hypothetical protein